MTTFRPATENDVDAIVALNAQAFNPPASWRERIRKEPRVDTVRLAEDGGRVAGMMRFLPFAHHFGGRAVRAAGVASVAVAAEARGRGVGSALMRETLGELRDDGVLISSLYPATAPIYRGVGYGFGGIRTEWKAAQNRLPQRAELKPEPFEADSYADAARVYDTIGAGNNGLVARDDDWWRTRVLDAGEDTQFRYVVRQDGVPTGYLIYTLKRGREDWRSSMQCRDFHWLTPDAGRALLSLASLHRSTGRDLEWVGPPTEPLADLLDEDLVENEWTFRWMVRLLDVPGALEARGYLPHIEAGVTVGITDPLFDDNRGPWRIEVSGGTAKVERVTGTPDATTDVQTMATLWSGLHRARDEVRLGRLEARDAAVTALEAMFAGPLPWISDFF